ncbi:MAG: hypothetical protein GTO02_03560, partial [Candidatus Dadabacteria bacterium]|nr:hypothetical protein [Candidatus Dadabacteria bacterium]
SIDNVVGMKEESADTSLIREINTKYSIDYVVIGGRGGMSAHLDARVYGQKTYLVGIGNVQPNIEIDFVNALESGNKSRAEEIISKYEKPFFEVATRIGWHP